MTAGTGRRAAGPLAGVVVAAIGAVVAGALCAIVPSGRAVAQETAGGTEAVTFTLAGQIVDAMNGAPVIAALVKVPALRKVATSDVNGRFRLADFPEGTWDIVVEQLGYHTLTGSVTVAEGNGLNLHLNPDPVALEEIRAGGLTYKTRLRRRRNASGARSYELAGEALWNSQHEDVWDLVARREGFHFQGYSSYGCPRATIYGVPVTVGLYVDDRAVRIGIFDQYKPADFAMVEVYEFGAAIKAYTQAYLDRMTRERRVAVSSTPSLCPPESRTIYRRGRYVQVPTGTGPGGAG
ncbi:MAG: carboxypeptidase-like regulatory domain-containing protein [Gemmatimonadota bacterium]|nr:carboxypeptidase-like regulatory domain-containing protein [Gemmatimonadota bacterium]